MNPIKEAFDRIKEDIMALHEQIINLHQEIEDIKRTLEAQNPTQDLFQQTIQHTDSTLQHIPTDNSSFQAPISPNLPISIGNGGVPTDRQTNRQTDQHTQEITPETPEIPSDGTNTDKITQIEKVSEVLESLDSIKKEIRSNFKHLTSQEIAVFSAIYTLEEQGFVVDYSLISQKFSLSESSIRDYTNRLIKKGIPIIKFKENNKKVTLSISPELKKIASLQTILSLRKL